MFIFVLTALSIWIHICNHSSYIDQQAKSLDEASKDKSDSKPEILKSGILKVKKKENKLKVWLEESPNGNLLLMDS